MSSRRGEAGRVEHVRPRLLVGLEAADGVRQVAAADEEVLRPRGQHERMRVGVRHRRGGAHALDRQLEGVDRFVGARRRILDRAAGETGGRGEADGLGDRLRRVAEAVLQVGAHRQVGGADDRGHVRQHPLAADAVVALTGSECRAGAGRRQRLEAETGEQARRAEVPRIGNHERARARVQGAKRLRLLCCRAHQDCFSLMVGISSPAQRRTAIPRRRPRVARRGARTGAARQDAAPEARSRAHCRGWRAESSARDAARAAAISARGDAAAARPAGQKSSRG